MSSTRERALNAAVDLVGSHGIRALTHARVDAHAGLPPGSTSNHFRTRAALLGGVASWIAEEETRDLGAVLAQPFDDVDGFIDLFSTGIELLTGRFAVRTRARYALFLEAAADPALFAPLRAQREGFEAWSRSLLVSLGARDPDTALHAFMAFGDGILLHRLTIDPEAPVRPSVDAAVRGLLGG
ncbi:TetR/AcrR family transcriptional regulator [Microbacterium kyungheense]|jgi:AcrR family transcriptional regulator|uniref:TetR family transcriptional regulator n=1 Tax=Microbacterium kyungheense TaxID=1263636 RepID=A0A543F0Z6_9MICO|nr:TetR family transcriptional regulator [Microbacterium kyungheense]TQM27502.1 TetR family transcriptional regulator [Microbacterium kyungheense]